MADRRTSTWPRRLLAALALLGLTLGTLVVASAPASAAVDDRTPANGWRPSGGTAYALARAGDMVIIGGTFTAMVSPTGTTTARSRLAAVSASTGALLPWAPNPNGEVRAVTVSADGQTVYVGGTFTSIGGAARANLAAVLTSTGRATSFSADTNATVRTLLVHGNSLFVGGIFYRVRGSDRGGGAELDPTTGALKPWNPRTNYGTYAIEPAPDGSGIYVGGPFTSAGGAARSFVAKVATGTGNLLPWTSGSTCQDALNPCVVYAIRADGTELFLGMGGPGGRVTDLVAATGQQRWWTGGDGDVQALLVSGSRVYGGGHFVDTTNGVPRAGLVSLDRYTGAVLDELDARVVGGTGVWSLLADGDRLRFAGQFSTIDDAPIGRYSSFPIVPDPPDTTPPSVPSDLRSPAPLGDGVTLTWSASTDDTATVEYRVSRDGVPVGTSAVATIKDFGVSPSTTYRYEVVAADAAGNLSGPRALTLTTEAATPTLLPRRATWSFFSRGTLPAADWYASGFDDSGWSRGAGELGFGEGDEQTYISPLGVAHYFRTTFTRPSDTAVQSARLRMVVDDGAVVYLNGVEVGRHNMAAGTVTETTTASTAVGGDTEQTYQSMTIPVSSLRAGQNVLAVEVHNSSTQSSDVSFDAFLTYVPSVASVPAAPTDLRATPGPTSVALTWGSSPTATSYVVLRDGVVVGSPSTTSFTETGLTSGQGYSYRVAAGNDAGQGPASDPVTVTTSTPTPSALYAVSGDAWRFADSGADLGTAWRETGYDDAGWKAGRTQAGYGDGDEATTLSWGNDPNRKPLTVYARRTFTAGVVDDVQSLRLRLLVDDGAAVYLNGTELTRFNLPTGTITASTRASRALSGTEESQWRVYTVPRTALRAGENVVAAEVHNDTGSSSDLSFDLELSPVR